MRICYVLPSVNLGIHQYTADLANRMANAGHDVHLVTVANSVRPGRYGAGVTIHTPITITRAGISPQILRWRSLASLVSEVRALGADLVHITGPHAWNVPLARALKAQDVPIVHTLHVLDAQRGLFYRALLWLWNAHIIRLADHIMIYSQALQPRLHAMGVPSQRITCSPLLNLFAGDTRLQASSDPGAGIQYEPWALYAGRLERDRGLEHLITACAMMDQESTDLPHVVLAGPGDLESVWSGPPPARLEVVNGRLGDAEAYDLLRRCGLVVLPYVDSAQLSLIATAYWFRKPVVVNRTGALPEYVREGVTGRVLEPGHPPALARCLEELLDDPDRLAQMGAAGRAWYDARCANEETTLFQVYGDLVRERAARRVVARLPDHAT